MFANGSRDQGSIPGRVILKTQKMVLDASLLNTQHYNVWIKCKVEQSRERSSALPLHLSAVAIEKGAFRSPSTKVANLLTLWDKNVAIISTCLGLIILLRVSNIYIPTRSASHMHPWGHQNFQ